VLLAAVRDQRADAFAGALVGVPTHVRVGADDATVPAFFSRRMARLLRLAGAGSAPRPGPGLVLEEVPAKEHWWWDTREPNDGGVVNDASMRSFYEAHRGRLSAAAAQGRGEGVYKEPPSAAAAAATSTLPDDFVVLCANPRTHWSGRGGISVLQLMHAQTEARIEVATRRADGTWALATAGARRLRIVLPRGGGGGGAAAARPTALIIDSSAPIAVEPADDTLHLCARGQPLRWDVCFRGGPRNAVAGVATDGSVSDAGSAFASEWLFEARERGPHNAGPVRAVTATPFAIVYGTRSASPEVNEALLRGAQLLSQGHALASHAFAPIIADSDVRFCEESGADSGEGAPCLPCGTNLVLLGGPAQNAVTSLLHALHKGAGFAVGFPGPAAGPAGYEPFSVGGRVFSANATALLATVGWLDARQTCAAGGSTGALFGAMDALASPARLALVIAATDAEGLFVALRFAAPVIPPMVRAPFSNLVPDVMVLGGKVLKEGYGGVLLAGYWTSEWRLDEEASWVA